MYTVSSGNLPYLSICYFLSHSLYLKYLSPPPAATVSLFSHSPPWNRDGSWGLQGLLPPPIACACAKVVNHLTTPFSLTLSWRVLVFLLDLPLRPVAILRLTDSAAPLLLPSFLGPCILYLLDHDTANIPSSPLSLTV